MRYFSLLFIVTSCCSVVEFELIIPTYNNEAWCIKNIDILAHQTYPHWHATVVSDASTDTTHIQLAEYIETHNLQDKITLIVNSERHGALYNIVSVARGLPGNKVICLYDGDDFLAHENVLLYYAYLYDTYNVWLTYGQFRSLCSRAMGFCTPYNAETISNNQFRSTQNIPSHFRTFYAWLFQKIPEDVLKKDGEFYQMTWDQAIMFPLIEMAGERHLCIPQVTYIYNDSNPINDHKVDSKLQSALARQIRTRPKFQRLADESKAQARKKSCKRIYFDASKFFKLYEKSLKTKGRE